MTDIDKAVDKFSSLMGKDIVEQQYDMNMSMTSQGYEDLMFLLKKLQSKMTQICADDDELDLEHVEIFDRLVEHLEISIPRKA